MSETLRYVSLSEGVRTVRRAQRDISAELGRPQPITGLDVARRVDAMYTGCVGYTLLNHPFHFGTIPPGVVVLTDPEATARVLTAHEFEALTMGTVLQATSDLIKGQFVSTTPAHDQWQSERRHAAPIYGPHSVDAMRAQAAESGHAGLEDIFMGADPVPTSWAKILTLQIMTELLADMRLPMDQTVAAMEAHTRYLDNSLRPILAGALPKHCGLRLTEGPLREYRKLFQTIEEGLNGNNRSILAHIARYPDGDGDVNSAIVGNMLGCLNGTPTYLRCTLLELAKRPDMQQAIRDGDHELLTRVLQEIGRMYPPIPFTLRRATRDVVIEDTEVPAKTLVAIGIFAFGGEKNVENAHAFDPDRTNLDKLARNRGGAANIFSFGPRSCLARHFGPMVTEVMVQVILDRFDVTTRNSPITTLKGVSLRTTEPIQFIFTDRLTGRQIHADSAN